MSPMRCAVVFVARSVVGSLACGVLRPDPRWSNKTIRYPLGSKNRRYVGAQPLPGPPCSTTAGLPVGRAAGLPVDDVAVADIEHPALVGLDRRVEVGHATGYSSDGP